MKAAEKLLWLVVLGTLLTVFLSQCGRAKASTRWVVTEDSVAVYYRSGGTIIAVPKRGETK